MKKILSIILFALITVNIFSVSVLCESENSSQESSKFNLYEGIKKLEKRPFEFEDYKGKNLLVSFFTTWCPYCLNEMPDFKKFKENFSDDVEILMVHVPSNSTIDEAKQIFDHEGYTDLFVLLEDDFTYADAFSVMGFPTNLIFDKEGNMVRYGYGLTYDAIKDIFEKNNMFDIQKGEKHNKDV